MLYYVAIVFQWPRWTCLFKFQEEEETQQQKKCMKVQQEIKMDLLFCLYRSFPVLVAFHFYSCRLKFFQELKTLFILLMQGRVYISCFLLCVGIDFKFFLWKFYFIWCHRHSLTKPLRRLTYIHTYNCSTLFERM